MKQIFIIVSLFLLSIPFTPLSISAQNPTDSAYYERLELLCKVWGHVKYFHTESANGNVDMDDELLKIMPDIRKADTDQKFNTQVLKMIDAVGEMGISTVALPEIPDTLNLLLDKSWIDSPVFSSSVRMKLKDILEKFRPQTNVYVKELESGNPNFKPDNKFYSETNNLPDYAMKFLIAARYWNIVDYFFPYKAIMDVDWDQTLHLFIPKLMNANDAQSFDLALREFTTYIDDTHGRYNSRVSGELFGYGIPDFQVKFIENETVITGIADEAMVKLDTGDILKRIDGYDIYELRDSLKKIAYGSNEIAIQRVVSKFVLQGKDGSFDVEVDNGTEVRTETLIRKSEPNYFKFYPKNRKPWQTIHTPHGCKFGLVTMGLLDNEEIPRMFDHLKNTDVIIFDVRFGAEFDVINGLFDHKIPVADFTIPDPTYPGRLYWNQWAYGEPTLNPYQGKVIILVDERVQSYGEFTSMAIDAFPDVLVVGSQTAGADGDVSRIYLPGQRLAVASFIGVYYPDDHAPTQRVGIIPDIEIKPTIAGIRAHKEELLDYVYGLSCDLTAVDSPQKIEKIEIYPNPVNDHMTIHSDRLNEFYKIEIFDTNGRKVKSIDTSKFKKQIDVADLDAGVYILKMFSEGYFLSGKFIKL